MPFAEAEGLYLIFPEEKTGWHFQLYDLPPSLVEPCSTEKWKVVTNHSVESLSANELGLSVSYASGRWPETFRFLSPKVAVVVVNLPLGHPQGYLGSVTLSGKWVKPRHGDYFLLVDAQNQPFPPNER